MKRMWSVFTIPYFVFTVVPSTIGRMSRCTPSRLTSGPWPPSRPADLVDLVDEDDAGLLHPIDGGARHAVHVDELLLLFLPQRVERLGDRHAALARAPLKQAAGSMSLTLMSTSSTDDPAMISNDGNDARGRRSRAACGPTARRGAARAASRASAAPAPESRPRPRRTPRRRQRRQQEVEHALLGGELRLLAHFRGPFFPDELHGDLGQIADHRLDVAPDIPDLGEFRRLDLQEGGLRELRQPARDLGLADPGRADHEDVLRRHLLRHLGGKLLPAHAVPERDRDGALRRC